MNQMPIHNNSSGLVTQADAVEVTTINRVQILNGCFNRVTTEETVDWAMRTIQLGYRGYLCTVNVAILMMMARDSSLQRFVDNAALVVADGQPIVWASRGLANALPERVTGIDLIDALAKRAEQERFQVYLLGASREIIQAAAANLQSKYPRLEICGYDHGYFFPAEAPERVKAIRQSGAQILLVGMGVPRQDFFLEEHWSDLGVNLAIGVGGSFDVIAGRKKRAPHWVQQAGMEWLYRLLQEPKRLGIRYLVTNLQFIYQLSRAVLRAAILKPTYR
jgi:N-acetylglucosaminyldiphosphoundecaprenol N-acetyl-beta-D-mannosaminyltransferase